MPKPNDTGVAGEGRNRIAPTLLGDGGEGRRLGAGPASDLCLTFSAHDLLDREAAWADEFGAALGNSPLAAAVAAAGLRGPASGGTQATGWLFETAARTPTRGSPAREPGHALGVGDVVGKYELVERVGRGATSTVYRGRHLKLRFPVAVKVLDAAPLEADPGLLGRLVSEAVHLAQINHPNVVRLWDLEEDGPDPYLVLEYVRGGTLADLIQHKGRLPFPFAWAVVRQAAEGLAEAHKYGIVHRDVKPGNLLLAPDGHVKVADLGLAMTAGADPAGVGPGGRAPVGTSAYLAPEQAGDPAGVTFRADIYGLGATLYHALTGRLVFEGRSPLEVIMKHIREAPVPPDRYVADLPPKCSAVVLKMLAKRPEDRFASYDDLRLALAKAVGDRRAPRPLSDAFLAFAADR
jgi:serine/threonine protein kinase